MATRKQRVDDLITKLVEQLERAAQRPEGMGESQAKILLLLARHQMGVQVDVGEGERFTDAEKALIHDLARAGGEESDG